MLDELRAHDFLAVRLPPLEPGPHGWLRRGLAEAFIIDGSGFTCDGIDYPPAPQPWEPSFERALEEFAH